MSFSHGILSSGERKYDGLRKRVEFTVTVFQHQKHRLPLVQTRDSAKKKLNPSIRWIIIMIHDTDSILYLIRIDSLGISRLPYSKREKPTCFFVVG